MHPSCRPELREKHPLGVRVLRSELVKQVVVKMKVAIGSQNAAKVGAVESALIGWGAVLHPVPVPSGVSPQPLSDEETLQGAINRARRAREEAAADLGIGLEGGVVDSSAGLFLINWGALVDQSGRQWVAGGARIPLPSSFSTPLEEGKELGELMEAFTSRTGVRSHEGAVGIFTAGLVNRREMFLHVAKLLIGQYRFDTQGENRSHNT